MLMFMFLANNRQVWRDKTVPRALELQGAHDAHAFYIFAVI